MERLNQFQFNKDEALKKFKEISYVDKSGVIMPMDIVPVPVECLSVSNSEKLIPVVKKAIEDLQSDLSNPLHETELLPEPLNRLQIELLKVQNMPLFIRWDSVGFTNQLDPDLLPPAVEFQFRIGGLGFHTAIDESVLGSSPIPKTYAETLKKISKEKWGEDSPKVTLIVPKAKSPEVSFWAKQLNKHGIETNMITSIDNDLPDLERKSTVKKCLSELMDSINNGSRIIVRRELNLPLMMVDLDISSKIIRKVLDGEVIFEPPLPLMFDGKAISVVLSNQSNDITSKITARTEFIDTFSKAETKLNRKEGILKLGSGTDIVRSFGSHEVYFIKGMSSGQIEQLTNRIKMDLTSNDDLKQNNESFKNTHNIFWIWQPDIGNEKFKTNVLHHETEAETETNGRVRTMFFIETPNEKFFAGGFNINPSSKVVRGGNPIGSIQIKAFDESTVKL